MLRDISWKNAIHISPRIDLPLHLPTESDISTLYTGENPDFMYESVSIADVESTYFYDADIMADQTAMLESITSTRTRLAATMRAFIRALNQSLSGTGITAGNDKAGDAPDGEKVIGGANIGRVRKIQGIAVMPAVIPLSDGQSVSVFFHSPSGKTGTITAQDTLVAFQFLLNKRDVTVIVSPSRGRDVSLRQVTTALSNLIERNSSKFQKAQEKQQAIKSQLAKAQDEADQFEEQQALLVEKGDELQSQVNSQSSQLSDITQKADRQEDLNSELEAQLNDAKKKVEAETAKKQDRSNRAGALEKIMEKSGYKDTYVANWAYNQNISTADLADLASRLDSVDVSDLKDLIMYKGQLSDLNDIPALKARNAVQPPSGDTGARTLYWYGLRARPAGPGTLPNEPKPAVIASVEEAAEIPIVKKGGIDPSDYRHGAVAYVTPLDAADISQFELIDLQNKAAKPGKNAGDTVPLETIQTGAMMPTLAKAAINGDNAIWYTQSTLNEIVAAVKIAGYTENIEFAQQRFNAVKAAMAAGFGYKRYKMSGLQYVYVLQKNDDILTKAGADAFAATIKAVPPLPKKEPEPEPPVDVVPPADAAAAQAIEYLGQVAQMASSDLVEIRNARASVREAIAALTNAGAYEENEELVNNAALHLSDLLEVLTRGPKA